MASTEQCLPFVPATARPLAEASAAIAPIRNRADPSNRQRRRASGRGARQWHGAELPSLHSTRAQFQQSRRAAGAIARNRQQQLQQGAREQAGERTRAHTQGTTKSTNHAS